jgi:putative aldouronate transport system permease protein
MAVKWRSNAWFYVLAAPGLIYFLVFHYFPMWGVWIAFQDYSPFLGIFKSEWVGFEHFRNFLTHDDFPLLLKNTLLLSLYHLCFYFPFVLFVAIMLNELRWMIYKRFIQTILYLPHFISWVIIAGITLVFFGPSGVINHYVGGGEAIPFLISNEWFRSMMVLQHIWKDLGWGTIIFLAAIAGVNPELFEAATVDGAGRWRRIWHVTLPGIRSTIVILLLLRLGHSLESNFMQIFLMSNAMNLEVSDVFDLYVYRVGLLGGDYSFATAAGLFKSIVGLILVLLANKAAKAMGEEGVF